MYTFTFHNAKTGEVVTAMAASLNHAARKLGFAVSFGTGLPAPWHATKCVRDDGKLYWKN